MILGVVGFIFLWNLRKKDFPDGKLFMIYLMVASTFRFFVEHLRLQPRLFVGLSEAQLVSIGLFVLGFAGIIFLNKRHTTKVAKMA